ncbi:hypothetical protein FB107DRAFT_290387 [Schizophyllum commune]
MPTMQDLLGAVRQVTQPVFGDNQDLDAPFVAGDPFRTRTQSGTGPRVLPHPTDVDLESGATVPKQPLAQMPLEARTSIPAVIPASHKATVPKDHRPLVTGHHWNSPASCNTTTLHPTYCHPPMSFEFQPSIAHPAARASSYHPPSGGTPSIQVSSRSDRSSNLEGTAPSKSRPDSFISPDPTESSSKREGVHPPSPLRSSIEPHARPKLRITYDALATLLCHFAPTTLYLCALFRLPVLYFSRVARVLENAELCRRDIIHMAVARATHWEKALGGKYVYGHHFHELQGNEMSLPLLHFKRTWEHFVDNLLHEWKVLNVISALLTSTVLAILQIDTAAADPVVRTAALLALAMYKASEWALEAQKTTTNIFWNVWVMLAMPAVWLLWSIISFIVSIMAFVWRTGASDHSDPANLPTSPTQLLVSRIIISTSLALGAIYFVLVVRTFARYGDRIDRRWRENVHEQMRHERELKAREEQGRDSPHMGEMLSEPSPRGN